MVSNHRTQVNDRFQGVKPHARGGRTESERATLAAILQNSGGQIFVACQILDVVIVLAAHGCCANPTVER